jgi:hypothetical protein
MRKLVVLPLLLLLVLGCSEASSLQTESVASSPQSMQMAAKQIAIAETETATLPARREGQREVQKKAQAEAVPRKIVYTASVDLLVGDWSDAVGRLEAVTKQFHGVVAQSAITSNPGSPRSANWRVRVPVDRFDDFVNQIAGLGEATRNTTDSDDITDKYYDFQVRMENKKIEVGRLQKIINERTGKISEVLEAEREIGRVTTELEQLKGTLKLWDNQTALSTVNITMRERTRYVAPVVPTFASTAAQTFSNSVNSLVVISQNLALVIVALTPWLPLIVIAAFLARFGLRRAWQQAAVSMKEK